MKILAASVMLIVISTPAFALDNCDRFSAVSQLEDRLKCLQANNADLQKQIDALKGGGDVLRNNDTVSIMQGNQCLTNGPNYQLCNENNWNVKWKLSK